MKKKMMLVILCVLLLFSNTVWAVDWDGTSTEGAITPYMTLIKNSKADLDIYFGRAEIKCVLRGYSGVDYVEIYAELQQYRNGRWQTVDTFSMESNFSEAYLNESCSVVEGYSYRVRATMRAYSGSSSERDVVFSDTVMY